MNLHKNIQVVNLEFKKKMMNKHQKINQITINKMVNNLNKNKINKIKSNNKHPSILHGYEFSLFIIVSIEI